MNQAELQSVWTRMLDGQPLSSEEIAALEACLGAADSQDSQWLTDDFTTNELLRALHAEEAAESLDASSSAEFVRCVQEKIAEHAAHVPSIQAPPIVKAPPVSAPPPVPAPPLVSVDKSGQRSRATSRSVSRWMIAATAASILLVAATSIALLSERSVPGKQSNTAPNQPAVPMSPRGSSDFAAASRDGSDSVAAGNRSTPGSSSEKQIDKTGPPGTPPEDNTPIQIASVPSSNQLGEDETSRNPSPATPKSPPPTLAESAPKDYPAALAAVLQSDQAVWRDGYGSQTDLLAGPLELASGEVRLRLVKGTELTLSGPTKLQLIDDNRVSLTAGLITAQVPETAIGFEVQAPGGRIVDLGTRFTVDANPDEKFTVVKVIEGTVDVIQPRVKPRARERKTRLTAGRMKWLPFDGSQAFDWCLVAEFGDDPGHLAINGEKFDVRFLGQHQRAKVRLAELFQQASAQRELVPRGERFSGLLMIDDVRQILMTEDLLKIGQANLTERVGQLHKQWFLEKGPEQILNEIETRLRSHL